MDGVRAMEAAEIDARRIECMAFHPLSSARAARDPRGGLVDERGEAWELPELFVVDGSVLPTSIGVNSQIAIMATATKLAWEIDRRTAPLRAGRGASVQVGAPA
jgi:choline dehydrogenase-like flavoprotein